MRWPHSGLATELGVGVSMGDMAALITSTAPVNRELNSAEKPEAAEGGRDARGRDETQHAVAFLQSALRGRGRHGEGKGRRDGVREAFVRIDTFLDVDSTLPHSLPGHPVAGRVEEDDLGIEGIERFRLQIVFHEPRAAELHEITPVRDEDEWLELAAVTGKVFGNVR